MAKPIEKFLKILKKLFSKSFLSRWRAAPSSTSAEVEIPYLRLGKKKRKIGNAVTNFWLLFSAKKMKVLSK